MISFSSRTSRLDRYALLLLCIFANVYVWYARQHGQSLPHWGLLHTGSAAPLDAGTSWTRFAYGSYATSQYDLCHSVMLFESLHRLNAKAQKLLLYPRGRDGQNADSVTTRLLHIAQEQYNVQLQPIEPIVPLRVSDTTWQDGFTKLLSFNQTQYERLLMLDSDATILQTMDELFLLPASPVAMPRAYWLEESRKMTNAIMLVQPSSAAWARIAEQISKRKNSDFDMEVVNDAYGNRSMVLPHRPYVMLSSELASQDHQNYLTDDNATWNADAAIMEAKYIHFSDWPLPKPWLDASEDELRKAQPQCRTDNGTVLTTCAERRIWQWLYDDFRARRKEICVM